MPLNHNTSKRPKPRLLCTATPEIPQFSMTSVHNVEEPLPLAFNTHLFGVRGLFADHSHSLAHSHFDQTGQMRI